jgi:hypothetical protein
MSEVSPIPMQPDGVTSFPSSAHRSFSPSLFVVGSPSSSAPNSTTTIDASNDAAVRGQPSRYIDYLSHDWNRVDIWLSWKHTVYSSSQRVENALWRAWTASSYRLKRVPPEALNW